MCFSIDDPNYNAIIIIFVVSACTEWHTCPTASFRRGFTQMCFSIDDPNEYDHSPICSPYSYRMNTDIFQYQTQNKTQAISIVNCLLPIAYCQLPIQLQRYSLFS